jgi:hypothetical protein
MFFYIDALRTFISKIFGKMSGNAVDKKGALPSFHSPSIPFLPFHSNSSLSPFLLDGCKNIRKGKMSVIAVDKRDKNHYPVQVI